MEYQNERGWEYHQKMSSMLQLGQFLVMCGSFFSSNNAGELHVIF
jgi:hypothetical protein